MENRLNLVVAGLAILYLSSSSDGVSGPNKLKRDVPDVFEAFSDYPFAIAISDNDNDTIFECLSATRRDFDPEAKTVTYDWSLSNGPENEREIVSLHHSAGATPDATNFTIGDDDTVYVGYVRYNDNGNCAVTEFPFRNKELCTLWVSEEYKDMVPTYCLRHFHDICGVIVPLRDSDLCPDD
ncbi:uncharacterized protein LOC144151477 [Haemaphysalis longicornis]